MILEAITFYVALPIALAMVGYAAILATQQHYKAHRAPHRAQYRMSEAQYLAEMDMLEYGCVCSPGREMETTYGTTDAIEAALERHRHEMSVAIETERHHSELQRIHEKSVADAIDRYNRQHAPQPQPAQLPQPVRRTVPRLPAPNTVEIPIETQTTDGYRWVALEREVSEVSE